MLLKRRRHLVVGISAGVVAATFLVLILLPVPRAFTMDGAAIYDLEPTCTGIATTSGTTVTFHWSAGGRTYFFVVSCSAGEVAYQSNGTQGSGSFVSTGGVYEFGSSCPGPGPCFPADVVGTYTGPLLPL